MALKNLSPQLGRKGQTVACEGARVYTLTQREREAHAHTHLSKAVAAPQRGNTKVVDGGSVSLSRRPTFAETAWLRLYPSPSSSSARRTINNWR